jgi:hypothetical protein
MSLVAQRRNACYTCVERWQPRNSAESFVNIIQGRLHGSIRDRRRPFWSCIFAAWIVDIPDSGIVNCVSRRRNSSLSQTHVADSRDYYTPYVVGSVKRKEFQLRPRCARFVRYPLCALCSNVPFEVSTRVSKDQRTHSEREVAKLGTKRAAVHMFQHVKSICCVCEIASSQRTPYACYERASSSISRHVPARGQKPPMYPIGRVPAPDPPRSPALSQDCDSFHAKSRTGVLTSVTDEQRVH